jgi:hypothetical protein
MRWLSRSLPPGVEEAFVRANVERVSWVPSPTDLEEIRGNLSSLRRGSREDVPNVAVMTPATLVGALSDPERRGEAQLALTAPLSIFLQRGPKREFKRDEILFAARALAPDVTGETMHALYLGDSSQVYRMRGQFRLYRLRGAPGSAVQ